MADRIKNYSLGSQGIQIDTHDLLPGVSPEGLKRAENMTSDPRAGFAGAIRKRPGLARFNNEAFLGVLLGGIPMAVAQTGGAPAAGGGAILGTGDSGDGGGIVGSSPGTGDQTGAPGGTFDGGVATTSPAGAGAFTSSPVFSGARLIAIGLDDNVGSNDGGRAWYLTSKNFADTAVKSTVSTGPCRVYSFPTFLAPYGNGLQGNPACIGQDGRLYYAASHGNQATGGAVNGSLPIYVTDGGTATLLATITASPANITSYQVNPPGDVNIRGAVMSLHAATDGFLYAAVKWKYTGQDVAGSFGAIFRIRPTTGEVVEWNTGAVAANPVAYGNIPYCVNYYEGYLFVGEANNVNAGAANIIVSNGTEGRNELTSTDFNNVTGLTQFNGRLFAATGITKSAGTGLALLISRHPAGGVGIGYNNWDNHSFDPARTGNTTDGNSYVSMLVYNATTMFVSWNAPSTATIIYRLVPDVPGDPTSTSFTITTAKSLASNFAPLNLYLDDGTIYAISSGDSTQNVAWISTDGGVTWTDKSAQFGALATNSFAVPVFFGVDQ